MYISDMFTFGQIIIQSKLSWQLTPRQKKISAKISFRFSTDIAVFLLFQERKNPQFFVGIPFKMKVKKKLNFWDAWIKGEITGVFWGEQRAWPWQTFWQKYVFEYWRLDFWAKEIFSQKKVSCPSDLWLILKQPMNFTQSNNVFFPLNEKYTKTR